MAEQNYSGLFQTPEALMQAREAAIQQQAQAYAKQSPLEAARQLEYTSGARIGQGVRGLLGVQDTELQKVSEINDLVKMTDMTDEESVKKLAVALGQRGHRQAGEQVYMKYKELVAARAAKEKDEAEIGLKKAQTKKNESDAAKNAAETSAKALEATARKEALKALGVPETQIAGIASSDTAFTDYVKQAGTKITEADGKVLLINERNGNVIKELGTAKKGLEESLGAGLAKLEGVRQKEAAKAAAAAEGTGTGKNTVAIQGKYDALYAVQDAMDLVNQGIYTGTYANIQKNIAKGSLGVVGDRQRASNTEQFLAYIGETVIPRLQEFGGNDSVEELKYLRQVQAGDIQLEESAIKAILQRAEKKIQRGIERVQGQQSSIYGGKPLPTTPVSPPSPKALSDAELINKYLPKP